MTKKQMIALIAAKAHLTKRAASEAIETFLAEIGKALQKGEKVVLSGFGTFRVTRIKDKTVAFFGSGKKQVVKAHRTPRFIPGKPLKKQVK